MCAPLEHQNLILFIVYAQSSVFSESVLTCENTRVRAKVTSREEAQLTGVVSL